MRLKCINWFTLLHQPSMPEDPLECRIINLYGFGAAVEFCCCCCWHSFILSLCYGLQFLRFETLRSFCAFPVLKRPTKSVIYMWGYMQMIKERHQHSLNAKNDKCNKKKGPRQFCDLHQMQIWTDLKQQTDASPTFNTGEHDQRLLVMSQCCTKSFMNIYSQHLLKKSCLYV